MGDIRVGAESTLNVLGSWIQIVTGNLTGAQIYGYKGTRLSFADTLVSTIRDGGGSGTLGGINTIQVPSGGIALGATNTDFRQGAVVPTGNDHHLAIEGDGWFAVASPAGGITYTRNGEFHVDDAGNLVDALGNFVLGVFDDTKSLVLNDGTSFIDMGLPVVTHAPGLTAVTIGDAFGARAIPTAMDVLFQHTVEASAVYNLAGSGVSGSSGDGGPADAARLNSPAGLVYDATGNLYIADAGNHRVRRVDAVTGLITTVAGTGVAGSPPAGVGGPATAAELNQPTGLLIDAQGNLIITEGAGSRILRVDAQTGILTVVSGAGGSGFAGDGGPASAAALNGVYAPVMDRQGNLYVCDSGNHRIRRIDAKTGVITTIAGTGTASSTGDAGPASAATLNTPVGMAYDGDRCLYVAESGGHRIRRIDLTTGTITTAAGIGLFGYNGDGISAATAMLASPSGLAFDPSGKLLVADRGNQRVRRIDLTSGLIDTVLGTGTAGGAPNGTPAGTAAVNTPRALVVDGAGNLYVSEVNGHRVRMLPAVGSATSQEEGLYTFLDQAMTGYQDRLVATRYLGEGQIRFAEYQTTGTFTLLTLRTVDGTDVPITLTLTDVSNRPDNTAYDNARLIAEAINTKSNETGVAVSVVRDRRDPLGRVALVMGHVQRTLSEAFIDFTDPVDPSADLLRTGAGLTSIVTDAQGNVLHTVNVKTLTAAAPGYRPQPGDRITFDATGQMINLSRGASAGSAPPLATGVHVALVKPANAAGFEKSAGSSRFAYTDAAGRLIMGYAGLGTAAQIGPLGIQTMGTSTIGAENRMRPQALEGSNTSVTDLLPELLIAQRVFTSTTKLINVGNTLVDDLNGLIR